MTESCLDGSRTDGTDNSMDETQSPGDQPSYLWMETVWS